MTSGATSPFGFTRVPAAEKASRVDALFSGVAAKYDLMNDLMSFGLHRIWKRALACLSCARPGERWLDLAGGSGDMAALLARRVAPGGQIILADSCAEMLALGMRRLAGREEVRHALCRAERLPFASASFDGALCAFGLRNFADPRAALREMHRTVRPGGRLLVMEFSQPLAWLRTAHRAYLLGALPALGAAVAGDRASYRYLAESILAHPDQREQADMMREAGWEDADWLNFCAGTVAVHTAHRPLVAD